MNSATTSTISNRERYYRELLIDFDAAVCEAIAVSQAVSSRQETPAVGYSTHVFARICAHAQSMICAAPKSRWVKRDFDHWDVSAVAPHARSIVEGYILFRYLADAPYDLDIQRAYVNIMHLYDCKKRIKILPHILPDEEILGLQAHAKEITSRLEASDYFCNLDIKLKNDLLAGKWLMITPQKDVIASLGLDQSEFDFVWNYLSQYTHVLSFSFHRIEPNGRGTGLENDADRDALRFVLGYCTRLLVEAADRLVELFPDAAHVRCGMNSKFAPGPTKNLPKQSKRDRKKRRWS